MKYRVLPVVLLLVSAGCVGGGTVTAPPPSETAPTSSTTHSGSVPPASVNISDVTVVQGESAVIGVTARNVGEFHLDAGVQSNLTVPYENTTFEPSPTFTVTTHPPYWAWEPVRSTVTLQIPLHTTNSTSVGTYRVEAVAWNDTEHTHENGTTETFVVQVVNSSG